MSFRLKTILGVASIEAVLLAFLVITSLADLRTSNEAELAERARTSATLFATTTKDAVLSTDLASLETFVEEMLRIPGIVYARVVSEDHGMLAAAGDDSALTRPFEADAAVSGVTDGVFDTAVPITEGDVRFGQVEIGVSTAGIGALVRSAQNRLGLIAVGEMVLVALFSAALGVYLTRQLHGLRDAAQAVAGGDLHVEVPVQSRDEIGQVASAFNWMTERLRDSVSARDRYERELETLNQELEARVERRTARLQAANEALESTNTKLKVAQSQLVHSEKMASVGQLAAGVAHEINNPIAFVRANLKELERTTADLFEVLETYQRTAPPCDEVAAAKERVGLEFIHEDLPEILRESGDGIERVCNIVANLKEFSHVGRSEWQSHDVHQCLDSTLTIAKSQFKHRVEVVKHYGTVPDIDCIPSELNQVFMNLIINASQAIEDEGTVTLRTGVARDHAFIEVEDDGCGIPPEVESRIFDPFFTTKAVGTGTGLGLSVSFGIVERHGGRIEVSSKSGAGTCFRVLLPLEQPESERAADPCPEGAAAVG